MNLDKAYKEDAAKRFIEETAASLKDSFGERLELNANDIELIYNRLDNCINEYEDKDVLKGLIAVVTAAAVLTEHGVNDNADHPLPHCDWCGSWMHFSPTVQIIHKDDCKWLALQKAIEVLQESMKPT